MPLIGTTDAPGLLLRIRADSSDAVKDIAVVGTAIKGLASGIGTSMPPAVQSIATFGQALTGIAGPASIALGVTAGLAAGVAAVGIAAFAAAKQAADYGDEIFDMAQKTGVGTDSLQAFKVAAEQSGSSLESIENQLTKFTVLLGKAAQGNKEAQATLEKYGITAKDIDGALAQAIERISEMRSVQEQNAAAAELFKDRGGNVVNMIREMDGDLPGAIARLKEMGILMGGEDVAAAAEFADAMDDLNKQFEGIVRTIGAELLPVFLELAREISTWLKSNPGEVKSWANSFHDALRFVQKEISATQLVAEDLADLLQVLFTGGIWDLDEYRKRHAEINRKLEALTLAYKNPVPQGGLQQGGDVVMFPGAQTPVPGLRPPPSSSAEDEDVRKEREKAAKEAAKKREEAFKRELAAQKEHIRILLETEREGFKTAQETVEREYLKRAITTEKFLKDSEQNAQAYVNRSRKLLEDQFKLDVKGQTATEIENLRAQKALANAAIEKEAAQFRIDTQKLATKETEKDQKKELEDARRVTEAKINLHETAAKRLLADKKLANAQGLLSDEDYSRQVHLIEEETLKFRIKKLTELQAAAEGNKDEQTRIAKEIADAYTELYQKQKDGEIEIFLLRKRNAQELKQLQLEVLQVERGIFDARAEEARQELERNLDKAIGPQARLKVLEEMRDLEEFIAAEHFNRQRDDIDREEKAALDRIKGKENEEEQKFQIEELYKKRRLMSEEEFQRRLKEIRTGFEEDADPFKSLKDSWDAFKNSTMQSADLEASLASIGGMFLEMAQNMEDALKSAIVGWILYGDSIGTALKKALAAQLAYIAAEAAINALRAAAWGLFYLATFQWEAAGQAFASAALWAAVAIAAGAAATAINPKKQTAAGSAGAANNPGPATAGSGRGGEIYSANKDLVLEGSRMSPGAQRHEVIEFRVPKGWLGDEMKRDISTNGPTRLLIRDVATDS